MFASVVFVAFVSVKYRSRSLALLSLVLAGVVPLLIHSPEPYWIELFSYLFIVVCGVIWIVWLTGIKSLTLAALILVTFNSLPCIFSYFLDTETKIRIFGSLETLDTLLIFSYVFATVFFITNIISIIKSKGEQELTDLLSVNGNGLFLLAWTIGVAPAQWQGLIISVWAIIFAIGGFFIFIIIQKRKPFFVYSLVSIVMLTVAIILELEGAALKIAYILESVLIPVCAYVVLQDINLARRLSLLSIWSILISRNSITSPLWETGVFHADFFVLLALGCVLLGVGLFFSISSRAAQKKKEETSMFFWWSVYLDFVWMFLGSIYLYVLLWLSLHAWLANDNIAVAISLITYTLIGIFCYFYSFIYKKIGEYYGGALVGFVAFRLLFVDAWVMTETWRIIVFFLVGILLAGTAFLKRKKQNTENENDKQPRS
jgi:uncharacterized membrane protein